jgi:hypothetical protein
MASPAQAVPRSDLALARRGDGLGEHVVRSPSGQPLGGVKRSGFGREMCAETLLGYGAAKAISLSLVTARPGLWGSGP